MKRIKEKGIILISLVITTIFFYDENIKSSNNKLKFKNWEESKKLWRTKN